MRAAFAALRGVLLEDRRRFEAVWRAASRWVVLEVAWAFLEGALLLVGMMRMYLICSCVQYSNLVSGRLCAKIFEAKISNGMRANSANGS